ncbi:MAG: bifunctional UDP-N-acetylglucosamine diphosphorylase/glucosamine-1-phosphate N-acetyltransferase GlmU [Pseudomonadota bacterium]|nr:bifunctional UDP-N-acetylglucosamine diphosphorylase/glucosamine-1-phosphate N-acetyltransferase GlmU [Pseudomonadota bacterium]
MKKIKTAFVVLAAGLGTRMKSNLPKVLHPVAGRPLIGYILDRLKKFESEQTLVIVPPDVPNIVNYITPIKTVEQKAPLGTGHALLAARDNLAGFDGDVLVVFGDTPLLTRKTIESLLIARRQKIDPAVVVLGFRPSNPGQYGRLVLDSDGALEKIVEFSEASDAQKELNLCNAGIMAFDGKRLISLLDALNNDNSKEEYFLTDIVGIALQKNWVCSYVETENPWEVMGVNTQGELAEIEAEIQRKLRKKAMDEGVSLTDPETVWFCYDTKIGKNVTIGQNVVFGLGVTIGDNVEIKAFSHLEGAVVADKAIIGPFARLRPGTVIGKKVRVGNFVEIKAARLEEGVKASHLSYIGDSRVGSDTNIGAGVVTCNYDGFNKHITEIGKDVFIGTNTALIAPVKIGKGAFIAAGSVISKDVKENSLAMSRAPQKENVGWALKYRMRNFEKTKDTQKKA